MARLLLRERSAPVEVRPGQTPAHCPPLIPYATTRDTIPQLTSPGVNRAQTNETRPIRNRLAKPSKLCDCEQCRWSYPTQSRSRSTHNQDPDHTRARDCQIHISRHIRAGQRHASRVPPADQEPSCFIQSKEAWVLLELQVGCLEGAPPSRQPRPEVTVSNYATMPRGEPL
jgi:hypothetical protein